MVDAMVEPISMLSKQQGKDVFVAAKSTDPPCLHQSFMKIVRIYTFCIYYVLDAST